MADSTGDEMETRSRPLIVQAAPDRPVFLGTEADGQDLLCGSCERVLLLQNVTANSVLDLDIQCAGCGAMSPTPTRPPGRGLGGVMHVVTAAHRAVGTFVMDMDEVIVGAPAVESRSRETNRGSVVAPRLLDAAGIQAVIDDARSTFAPILSNVRPPKHRLARLLSTAEAAVAAMEAGKTDIDFLAVLDLGRVDGAFRGWALDPYAPELVRHSKDPITFDHNAALLQVARLLEISQLGPEFVPTGDARSPDLVLRISATRRIQVDTKALRAIQRPPPGSTIKVVSARETVRKALTSSRGQFTASGILVLAGDFWVDGLDAYAAAASKLLAEPLAPDASPAAREHYERLLGVVLASLGWDAEGRTYRDRLFLRWVPSPRYAGSIDLRLPPDMDGEFTIRFRDSTARTVSRADDDEPDSESPPTFANEPFDPVRFALTGEGMVMAEGVLVHSSPGETAGPLEAFFFPEGFRPAARVEFDAMSERGFTVVAVNPDGGLVIDPDAGWVRLHGVRFKASDSLPAA